MNNRKLLQDLTRSKNAARISILVGCAILLVGIYLGLYYRIPGILPICAGLTVLCGYGANQILSIFRENYEILHARQDGDIQRIQDRNFIIGELEPDTQPEHPIDRLIPFPRRR